MKKWMRDKRGVYRRDYGSGLTASIEASATKPGGLAVKLYVKRHFLGVHTANSLTTAKRKLDSFVAAVRRVPTPKQWHSVKPLDGAAETE